MKKYRYVEFGSVPPYSTNARKSGYIYFLKKPTETEIKEFNLQKFEGFYTSVSFGTTLAEMGQLGWLLKFVIPYTVVNTSPRGGCSHVGYFVHFRKGNRRIIKSRNNLITNNIITL